MGCSLEFGYMYYWWASKASETVLIKNKKIRYYMCLFVWDAQIQLFRLIAHSFFWYYSSKQIMIFLRSAFISSCKQFVSCPENPLPDSIKNCWFLVAGWGATH